MHCFSGVERLPVLGDQAVSQINPPASLKIIRPNSEDVEFLLFHKMSSSFSEVDVIRTQIPASDSDDTVLYAYEPNTACVNKVSNVNCHLSSILTHNHIKGKYLNSSYTIEFL